MEYRGEACLHEGVGQLRRSGMSTQEIAGFMGLEPAWVAAVVEMLPEEEPPGTEEKQGKG